MPEPSPLRRWLIPAGWSVGLLAVVLVGSIVSVTMLSDRDAITLAGGIAVLAVSILAWFAVTGAMLTHALRGRRHGAAGKPSPRCAPRRTPAAGSPLTRAAFDP